VTSENIAMFINNPTPRKFTVSKEAIKLKNVKQFQMFAKEQKKREFLIEFYSKVGYSQAMIFVNKKDTATFLQ
jgi:superfamily II DNA/RNA helicase